MDSYDEWGLLKSRVLGHLWMWASTMTRSRINSYYRSLDSIILCVRVPLSIDLLWWISNIGVKEFSWIWFSTMTWSRIGSYYWSLGSMIIMHVQAPLLSAFFLWMSIVEVNEFWVNSWMCASTMTQSSINPYYWLLDSMVIIRVRPPLSSGPLWWMLGIVEVKSSGSLMNVGLDYDSVKNQLILSIARQYHNMCNLSYMIWFISPKQVLFKKEVYWIICSFFGKPLPWLGRKKRI